MLDDSDDFAQLCPRDDHPISPRTIDLPRDPVTPQRSWREKLTFYIANWLFITPIMSVIYAVLVSDGLRLILPATQTRLSKIPFLEFMERYQAFYRLDLAILISLALYQLVTWLWMQIFLEILGYGSLSRRRHCPLALKCLLGVVSFIFLALDSGLFYYGLSAKMQSSWTEAPALVLPAATIAFAAAGALIGWIHCDFRTANSL